MTFQVDVGKIKFLWRGNYDAATTYTNDDVVYYDGSAWVNVVPANLDGTAGSSTGQTPATPSSHWNKMAQGSDLGSLAGLTTGSIVYFDGSGFQQSAPSGSHESVVIRNGVPVYKPQGIIQLRRTETNKLLQVNSGSAITAGSWYPINQYYDIAINGGSWQPYDFEVEITPKFNNSILEVNLSLHVGWREGSYHQFGRIMYWNGTSWARHPSKQRDAWHALYAGTEADHGVYAYTTNGATYVYQGEQVQLKQYYDVDGTLIQAGVPTKFRWEYTSTSAISLWLNAHQGYYNNNYSRHGNSFISVTEINNGD